MPALRGSLTYVRFFVEGEAPDDPYALLPAIALREMKPLDPEEDAPERSGWCKIGDPFGAIDEDAIHDGHVNLGYRTDKWVIPGPMFRAKVKEAEEAYLAKKGRTRMSKKEKTELKETVAKKLRKLVAPTTRSVDISWAVEEGIVRFYGHGNAAAVAMTDLFEKTFGKKLVPEAPYTLAAWDDSQKTLGASLDAVWDALEPTSFESLAGGT